MTVNEIVHTIIWGMFLLIILIVGLFWIFLVPKWNKGKGENGETESEGKV